MFLSGGAGFQSTKVIARSFSVGAKTCTASTFSAPGFDGVGDVEFVGAPGSGHVVGVGDLLSVQPDVGAIVDAVEIQPDGLSLVSSRQRQIPCDTTTRPRKGCRAASRCWKNFRRWDKSRRETRAGSCAKNGSGRVLSFTSAATTVVGTVTSCQPLGQTAAWK